MDAFTVETLSLPQIRALYRERMTRDFPPDELKPLTMIEKALARDEADRTLLAEIRFRGFFRKFLTDFCVFFVQAATGRRVRYPD